MNLGDGVLLTSDTFEDLLLHEEKKLSDRANLLITAQSFLFGGFATLIADLKLTGWHLLIPAVVCIIGISLNIVWWLSNQTQIKKTSSLAFPKTRSPVSTYFSKKVNSKDTPNITDLISKWMPILLGIAWFASLVFYVWQIL